MVYVDALRQTTPSQRWPYRQACHLLSDNLPELHDFAARLGLSRAWFQPKSHPHYDLSLNKRRQAITRGAKEISPAEFLALLKATRTQRQEGCR